MPLCRDCKREPQPAAIITAFIFKPNSNKIILECTIGTSITNKITPYYKHLLHISQKSCSEQSLYTGNNSMYYQVLISIIHFFCGENSMKIEISVGEIPDKFTII